MNDDEIFFLLDRQRQVEFPGIIEKLLLDLRWGLHYFLNSVHIVAGKRVIQLVCFG